MVFFISIFFSGAKFLSLNNFFFFFYLVGIHHKSHDPIIRSHHRGYTASHPNCEVKHGWARSVLRWGTTRESRVSNVFFEPNNFFVEPIFFLCCCCTKFFFLCCCCRTNFFFMLLLNQFFLARLQRMQNAPPNREKKEKQTGKPRLNLTRSLQQGNSR